MLSLQNVVGGYGGMQILNGVSIEVNPGEIVALIGPNGAGKSTLLKSIFSLCDIYSGKIMFKGKDITELPTHLLIQEGISFVSQGRPTFSDLTVRENLEMGAFVLPKGVYERNIEDVLSKFPFLRSKMDHYAFTLSGGQRQSLAIARGLIQNPEILLLDEPSLGLSPKVMNEVFATIQAINKEGVTIIIVEQNAKHAVSIADRTYVLESGTIGLEGGREILNNPKVKEIYFGE